MAFMETDNLTKAYGKAPHTVTALRTVELSIEQGEFVSIMGESGAGKSTLLSLLGALDTPTSGRYRVDGLDIFSLSAERQADFRREYLGFVFQSFHLMPYLSVIENVMLPLTPTDLSKAQKRELAEKALARVGIQAEIERLPTQISGGQKERVALARALVNDPLILLADEPTGNLDTVNTHRVMDLLRQLNAEGMTIVMVTHSPRCAGYAHRWLQMEDGACLSATGPWNSLQEVTPDFRTSAAGA